MGLPASITKWLPPPLRGRRPLVSVLRLSGVIGGVGGPLSRGLNLGGLASAIERAFAPRGLAAVALAINSPGGSPVQSALIASRIREWAEDKHVPVLAFCEDVAASGGYWLATAADEIFADPSSVIGSIGVVSQGFGFADLIGRFGVTRRLYTAGDHKAPLDPFQPERAEDVQRLQGLLAEIHTEFKAQVRTRRGDRLKGDEAELFSGAFWTGRTALSLGLVDGLGAMRPLLRQRFGADVRLRLVGSDRRSWLRWLRGPESHWAAGAGAGDAVMDRLIDAAIRGVDERLWRGRYGL